MFGPNVALKSSEKAALSGLSSLDAHGNVGNAAPTDTQSPECVQIPCPAPLKMEDGGQEGDAGTSLLFSHTFETFKWTYRPCEDREGTK